MPSWFCSSFLCEDTVETRILELQQKKLELADGVLTGAKQANKLTFDDLKSLFNLQWCECQVMLKSEIWVQVHTYD